MPPSLEVELVRGTTAHREFLRNCQVLTDQKERAVIYAGVHFPAWLRRVVGSEASASVASTGCRRERAPARSWKAERGLNPSGTLLAVLGSGSSTSSQVADSDL